jgi:hypothetical protein
MSAAASAAAKQRVIDTEDAQCNNPSRREIEPAAPGKRMRRQMKRLSFPDAYGLGLIAKYPQDDWSGIRQHLSTDAQKIAQELISPSSRASREIKSVADELRNLARKVDNPSVA